MYGALSSPLKLTGNFEEDVNTSYEYFQKTLNDRTNRPTLYGKWIFIEARETIDNRPQGFWHIISIQNSHNAFKVFPCTNDENIDLCAQNCVKSHHSITISGCEVRNICLLRASRLPWLIDIIELANKNDPSICVWLKKGNRKRNDKLYLRYHHFGVDYVVIFSIEKRFYRLLSAFPVFYANVKATFDKEANQYRWSYCEEKT